MDAGFPHPALATPRAVGVTHYVLRFFFSVSCISTMARLLMARKVGRQRWKTSACRPP
jgi:hypothetical protein